MNSKFLLEGGTKPGVVLAVKEDRTVFEKVPRLETEVATPGRGGRQRTCIGGVARLATVRLMTVRLAAVLGLVQ